MYLRNRQTNFQFDNHLFIYQYISSKRTDDLSIIANGDWPFDFRLESALEQLPNERVLIHRFKESWTKSRVHFHCCADDLAANVVPFLFLFHLIILLILSASLS